MKRLGLADLPDPDLGPWTDMVRRVQHPASGQARIAVVGKYTELVDSYKSVQEALIHGGIANDVKVDIDWVLSETFTGRGGRRATLGIRRLAYPRWIRPEGGGRHASGDPMGAGERDTLLRGSVWVSSAR